jgi:hypothetical protein
MASATAVSPAGTPIPSGRWRRLARFHIQEEDTVTAQLATLGYAPAEVDTAILSHLHEDHIGGLSELGGADLLIAAAEWEQLSGVSPELRGFLASTSRSRDCGGARSASSRPATRGWPLHRFVGCPGRRFSSWCRLRVTRPGRCPC